MALSRKVTCKFTEVFFFQLLRLFYVWTCSLGNLQCRFLFKKSNGFLNEYIILFSMKVWREYWYWVGFSAQGASNNLIWSFIHVICNIRSFCYLIFMVVKVVNTTFKYLGVNNNQHYAFVSVCSQYRIEKPGCPISYRCGLQSKLPFWKSLACVRSEPVNFAQDFEFHESLKETFPHWPDNAITGKALTLSQHLRE